MYIYISRNTENISMLRKKKIQIKKNQILELLFIKMNKTFFNKINFDYEHHILKFLSHVSLQKLYSYLKRNYIIP